MKTIFHKSSERGFADHGWLKARHSFSFANYQNSEKMHFGKMRVLNDDIVAPSRGFDEHPHQDMEIITIPLSGNLKHNDNIGNEGIIKAGEVQVMSAGTGVYHSEFNASDNEDLNLFQIWIFTDKRGHEPRYGQKRFSVEGRTNKWQLFVSPDERNGSLSIHQNAFISQIDAGDLAQIDYDLHDKNNGVYFMLIEGEISCEGQVLEKRDAAGFWEIESPLGIHFNSPSKLLAVEVPMQ
ncbi:MAG TPA: pirin family protein [Prolixibacteraceae bacterium]|nr:pirin family protein [Prolixibacteraceae bacterium]